MLHLQGRIAEADRAPGTWEAAEQFLIIQEGLDAQLWHLNPEFREQLGRPDINPGTYLLQVPETGIEQYAGTEGSPGYRFGLGGGVKLAIVLRHDAMHVTPGGEVAPGIGDFRTGITHPKQGAE
jgi:hypothetical protein